MSETIKQKIGEIAPDTPLFICSKCFQLESNVSLKPVNDFEVTYDVWPPYIHEIDSDESTESSEET